MLTEKQIVKNWNTFLSNITIYISPERANALTAFYEQYENRFALMPASIKTSYHNAFPGGYIDYVNRVLDCSIQLTDVWRQMGANIDFTTEELAMVAINHDLGKFGTEEAEYYIENDSEWHTKNHGQMYKLNDSIPFMKVQDRSLFILQSISVNLTENEYLGIKLHDGLYEEGNKDYLIASSDFELKSHLPYIIHQAALMAVRIGKDLCGNNKLFNKPNSVTSVAAADAQKKLPERGKAPETPKTKKQTGHRIIDKFLYE